MTNSNLPLNQDDWLADFTDQALAGRPADPSAAGADVEAQALANMVLRIKHAFPPEELEAAAVKRMHRETLARWRTEQQSRKKSWTDIFHLDWLVAPNGRNQVGWSLTVIAIAGLFILALPVITSGNSNITGSAGAQLRGVVSWIIPLAVILAMVWLLRRK